MCIIVIKPENTELPSKDRLRMCFKNNPDGAGLMYPLPQKGMVRIYKGFMSFEDFWAAARGVPKLHKTPLVMHFRIGTQGKNNKANTHPFPITANEKALGATSCVSPLGLVHNGIINLTTSYISASKEVRSDTYYFVKDYASLICKDVGWHKDTDKIRLLDRLSDSKLAIMDGNGHTQLVGKFHKSSDGCSYSNTTYNYTAIQIVGSGRRYTPWEDAWDDYGQYNRVTAKFVAAHLGVLNEDNGSVVPGDSDMWVYDLNGFVYLYDDNDDTIIPMTGYTVVNDKMEPQVAVRNSCVRFHVYGDRNPVMDW